MAQQLARVNTPQTLAEALTRLEDQQQLIDSLRQQLRTLQRRPSYTAPDDATPVANVVTASQFARMHGVAVSTITRRFEKGELIGTQNRSTGTILLNADQPYTRRKRGRKTR